MPQHIVTMKNWLNIQKQIISKKKLLRLLIIEYGRLYNILPDTENGNIYSYDDAILCQYGRAFIEEGIIKE